MQVTCNVEISDYPRTMTPDAEIPIVDQKDVGRTTDGAIPNGNVKPGLPSRGGLGGTNPFASGCGFASKSMFAKLTTTPPPPAVDNTGFHRSGAAGNSSGPSAGFGKRASHSGACSNPDGTNSKNNSDTNGQANTTSPQKSFSSASASPAVDASQQLRAQSTFVRGFNSTVNPAKRLTKSTLNKITVENFSRLADTMCATYQSLEIKAADCEKLAGSCSTAPSAQENTSPDSTSSDLKPVEMTRIDFLNLILDKSVGDVHLIEVYVDLLTVIAMSAYNTVERNEKVPITLPKECITQRQQVRRLLACTDLLEPLELCVQEKVKAVLDAKDANLTFYTGVFEFIGQAYVKGLISPQVVLVLCQRFLMVEAPDESRVEATLRLLRACGKYVDQAPAGRQFLDTVFARLTDLCAPIHSKHISTKCTFAIKNLQESRQANWDKRSWESGAQVQSVSEMRNKFQVERVLGAQLPQEASKVSRQSLCESEGSYKDYYQKKVVAFLDTFTISLAV